MERRNVLLGSATVLAGLAGCTGSTDGESETASTEGGPRATPQNTVLTFYETLYGEDDLDGANAMYHPASPAEPATKADFESYGGLENMTATVNSTELVSEAEKRAEVHAEVRYSTPIGSATHSDWFVLGKADGEWAIVRFLPQSQRDDMSDQEIDTAIEDAMNSA